jgi:2-furoyl-CoA dehydrogenase FAD binding subunit
LDQCQEIVGDEIMKPMNFDYLRAETVDEALDGLALYGDNARLMAGGLSFGAMMNYRLVDLDVVIDISRLEELSYIRVEKDWVEVGATTTQAQLLAWPELAEKLPLLNKAMPHIGHFQTRSRSTVCGSICHSEPSSELPLCFATLGGEAVLRSAKGERHVSAAEFQTGMLMNSRNPDEMVVAVRFPVTSQGEGTAFKEFAQRKGDFAIVAVSAMANQDRILIGVGGVADRPQIRDWPITGGDLDEALNHLAWELEGQSDIHATAQYRRRLVRRLGRLVIEEAIKCRC